MPRSCTPYHSVDGNVHHIYIDCNKGNDIEKDKKRTGTGGKRLCKFCREIRAGKRTR